MDEPLRFRAREALDRIAGSLREPPRAWTPPGTAEALRRAADVSLAAGAAGQAILRGYLAPVEPDAGHERRAMDLLTAAAGEVSRLDLDASLFSGFCGVAWAMEHLDRRLGDPGPEDPLEEIDALLLAHLDTGGGPLHYDLVSGLVGLGVYAAERLPRPGGAALLGLVVERLRDRGERAGAGITWRTPEAGNAASPWPIGPFDLGLAHGVPGVIGLLAVACANGVETGRARPLLQAAIDWLLAQRLPPSSPAAFPHSAGPGSDRAPSRLAWCYGDLGIASALLLAARSAGEAGWEAEGTAIALAAAARDPGTGRVRDAPLCHGAAGVAHLFNRLHHATGRPELAEAARAWFRRALDYRDPAASASGFRTFASGVGEEGWVEDPGLVAGSAGIALALLAAVTPIEPEWDRMLLLSARAPGPGDRDSAGRVDGAPRASGGGEVDRGRGA